MTHHQAPQGVAAALPRRRGLRWVVFSVIAALALAGTVAVLVASDHRSGVAPAILIWLCVVGCGAAVLAADTPAPPGTGVKSGPGGF